MKFGKLTSLERTGYEICNREIDGEWEKKFHAALPKTKFVAFKMTAKFTKVEKNNKQCTMEINRDMLCWLLNLSVSSGMVINYEKAMEYPLSAVPLRKKYLKFWKNSYVKCMASTEPQCIRSEVKCLRKD